MFGEINTTKVSGLENRKMQDFMHGWRGEVYQGMRCGVMGKRGAP